MTTVFDSFISSDTEVDVEPTLPVGFEPVHHKDEDGVIRLAGWEKTVFIEDRGVSMRLMDVRVLRDQKNPRGGRAVVDFARMYREIGRNLPSPQDVLGVFPLDWLDQGNGLKVEGPWCETLWGCLDAVAEPASLVIRKILDALDKRHERSMPVFDIWMAVPEKDGNPSGATKLIDRVKGENFKDAVKRWARENGGHKVGPVFSGSICLDGHFCFPSKEEAEEYLKRPVSGNGCVFETSGGKKEGE